MTAKRATLTHFDASGNAWMVDVGGKAATARVAKAGGSITMSPEAFAQLAAGTMAKGDVLGVARIAGIMAAKRVDELIPLTHPLVIDRAEVRFRLDEEQQTV